MNTSWSVSNSTRTPEVASFRLTSSSAIVTSRPVVKDTVVAPAPSTFRSNSYAVSAVRPEASVSTTPVV